jgi:hypothetical protein
MSKQVTIDKMIEMRLTAMADAFAVQADDPKMLQAVNEAVSGGYCKPLLVGDPEAIRQAAQEAGVDVSGMEIFDNNDADKKAELEKFAQEKLSAICTAGIEVQFSKNVAGGFKIGPKGEGYMISFTDKDFENIMAEYLRPKTKELLFG